MKKMYLFILVVLLLPVTSTFALTPPTETGQEVLTPYCVVGNGWWAGLVVHNTSGSAMTFSIFAYKENGDSVSGTGFTVAAHAMKVDLVENYFPNPKPTGALTLVIRCSTDDAPTFLTTLFIGNSEGGGFGFQNYTSWDWVHPIVMTPFDPSLPIFIPKWPIVGQLM
jgi:hypothetical protein